jgi:uncharacterized protein with PIN domain
MSSWSKIDLRKLKTKCGKCNKNTELVVRNKLPKKKKSYTYMLATRCKECRTIYFSDDSKIYFQNIDKHQKRLLNVGKSKKNPLVDYVVPETINFPDL